MPKRGVRPEEVSQLSREELENFAQGLMITNTKLNRERQMWESKFTLLTEAFYYTNFKYFNDGKFERLIEELKPEMLKEYEQTVLAETREILARVEEEKADLSANYRQALHENSILRQAFEILKEEPLS